MEQELLRKGTQFYLAQAQWLSMLLAKAAEVMHQYKSTCHTVGTFCSASELLFLGGG